MTIRSTTLLREHPRARLWKEDRVDPSGNPVVIFSGSTYVEVDGRRAQTPERPLFGSRAEGDAWFEQVVASAE